MWKQMGTYNTFGFTAQIPDAIYQQSPGHFFRHASNNDRAISY